MNPLFLIIYVVVITLLLTLVYPRFKSSNPRLLWAALILGIAGLVVMIIIFFTR